MDELAFAASWRPPTLETNRLWLRPLVDTDAAAVFAYASNPVVARYTLWPAHAHLDESRYFCGQYAISRYRERVPEPLGIVMKSDGASGAVIGSVGCFWADRASQCMELGYALGEPYWGQGVIAEAAAVLMRHCFSTYPIHRLQARVIAGNVRSDAVLKKLGFTFEGTLRGALWHRSEFVDLRMYAFLRPELPVG